jgi:hypothetical protein
MFLRNMLADFSGRSAYSKKPGNFTPYFQYKIGDFQQDYYLYFPKEPFRRRYENEVFNKLTEYKGADIAGYLDFHFHGFNDKKAFLHFVQYELSERSKLKILSSRRVKFQLAQQWVEQQQVALSQVDNDNSLPSPILFEQTSQQFQSLIDQMITDTEDKFTAVAEMLPSGNIEFNNRSHEEKLIQLLILLQQIQAPPQVAKAELVFKKFTAADIASILHLHFSAFRDNKVNTLQRKVGDQMQRIKPNHPKIKKLSEALQEFFY